MGNHKIASVLKIVAVISALAIFYFATQFATFRIIGNDGHFHMQFSRLMLERGLPEKLPELRYTIWNDSYRDHHLLFHLLQVPFSLIPDIRTAAKVQAATFAVCAAFVFWLILTQLGIRHRWFWLILFVVGSDPFLFRLQMPRVQAVALILLLVVIISFVKKRHVLLFVATLANVWLYDSFLLLFAVAASWLIACRISEGRWDLKPVGIMLAAIACGIVINPYFPENISSYIFNAQRSLAPHGSIPITAEWHPDSAWHLLLKNIPLLFVTTFLAVAIVSVDSQPTREFDAHRAERLFFLMLAIIFVILLFRSRRMVEYAAPVFILFLAVFHRDFIAGIRSSVFKTVSLAVAVSVIIMCSVHTYGFVSTSQADDRYRCYLRAGEWLGKNAPAAETIFLSDWDDFPPLYMQAPGLRYVVGLDPLFMLLHNEELYELYRGVTLGEHKGPYAPIIREKFDSHYVFTDTDHGPFISVLDNEPGVHRVFSEEQCRVYFIKDKQ